MRFATATMFLIGLTMWMVVPAGWLYIGSQIKAESESLGLALVVMGIGASITVVALVALLNQLNRAYHDDFVRLNDRNPVRTPLEPVLVVSAGVALAVFGIWFVFFSDGTGSTLIR
ncbi:MAG: hypothetical protein WAO61_00925 [Solirubrobacterales bacterium]